MRKMACLRASWRKRDIVVFLSRGAGGSYISRIMFDPLEPFMSRLMPAAVSVLFGAALGLGGMSLSAPASAQAQGERVNELIIYGKDPCPASHGSDITVCARKPEEERYRIPEQLRGLDAPGSEPWTNKVLAYETVGNFGINSCTPVGPGGSLGCTQKLIDAAFTQKRNSVDIQFSRLIEAEREKRLSRIDAAAAEDQARVDAADKANEEQAHRHQAEQDKADDEAIAAAERARAAAKAQQ